MSLYRSMHLIQDKEEKNLFLKSLREVKKPTVISFLNAHGITMAQKKNNFSNNLQEADYLLRDGVGMAFLLRILGKSPGLNMNGTDLIPEIIKLFCNKKIALCGTQDPWLSRSAIIIKETMGASIVTCIDGFQDESIYLEELKHTEPDLVVLAMGMPRQEEISSNLALSLDFPVVLINGGAILDFMSNRFTRAPLFWRKIRLEWLYRFSQEPRRLFRRYFLGGFSFLFLTLKIMIQERINK
ncbi:WecB/TagA/CpsF family glycosyltransferase [Desulfovibrio sp. UCD-KL4C]|uniref:WecB/TagA/CpsF family glycosyltransferase n=1 Tax=Desulfovibrio sp. UCD-KL4C TaxID=2578120 RepID=UPI0025B872DD|nr:WecB/TagA/CpsF family glycosyltransferase [Desulfovibrio sp. UCD-KL4C]